MKKRDLNEKSEVTSKETSVPNTGIVDPNEEKNRKSSIKEVLSESDAGGMQELADRNNIQRKKLIEIISNAETIGELKGICTIGFKDIVLENMVSEKAMGLAQTRGDFSDIYKLSNHIPSMRKIVEEAIRKRYLNISEERGFIRSYVNTNTKLGIWIIEQQVSNADSAKELFFMCDYDEYDLNLQTTIQNILDKAIASAQSFKELHFMFNHDYTKTHLIFNKFKRENIIGITKKAIDKGISLANTCDDWKTICIDGRYFDPDSDIRIDALQNVVSLAENIDDIRFIFERDRLYSTFEYPSSYDEEENDDDYFIDGNDFTFDEEGHLKYIKRKNTVAKIKRDAILKILENIDTIEKLKKSFRNLDDSHVRDRIIHHCDKTLKEEIIRKLLKVADKTGYLNFIHHESEFGDEKIDKELKQQVIIWQIGLAEENNDLETFLRWTKPGLELRNQAFLKEVSLANNLSDFREICTERVLKDQKVDIQLKELALQKRISLAQYSSELNFVFEHTTKVSKIYELALEKMLEFKKK